VTDEPASPTGSSDRRTLRRVLALSLPLGLAVLVCLPIGPVFKVYSAPSESMFPELSPGSYFVVSRLSYGLSRHSFNVIHLPIEERWPDWRPQRGDVVAFKSPADTSVDYVKRVIALSGDRVALKQGRLILNSVEVPRKQVEGAPEKSTGKLFFEYLPGAKPHAIVELQGDTGDLDDIKEIQVPDGHIFVMGDNRDNSLDSRVPPSSGGFGMVPLPNLVGKLIFQVGS
jgi:signal peptidase I